MNMNNAILNALCNCWLGNYVDKMTDCATLLPEIISVWDHRYLTTKQEHWWVIVKPMIRSSQNKIEVTLAILSQLNHLSFPGLYSLSGDPILHSWTHSKLTANILLPCSIKLLSYTLLYNYWSPLYNCTRYMEWTVEPLYIVHIIHDNHYKV